MNQKNNSESQNNSASDNEFDEYTYYNKKTERRIFKPIYVVHDEEDLKNVFTYLRLLIEYLEKKINYFNRLDFFYYDFKRFRCRSFLITWIKHIANKGFVSSFEEELFDVIKNIDFLSTKYDAFHLAYPKRFIDPKISEESKEYQSKTM